MNKILFILKDFGFSEKSFNQYRISENNRDSDFEFAIKIIDEIVEKTKKNKWGFTNLQFSFAYFNLALFAAENGIQNISLHRKSHYFKLLNYKESGVFPKVKILAAPNCCDQCDKNNGKIFSLDEAIEKLPLPLNECTNNYLKTNITWCRCIFVPVII